MSTRTPRAPRPGVPAARSTSRPQGGAALNPKLFARPGPLDASAGHRLEHRLHDGIGLQPTAASVGHDCESGLRIHAKSAVRQVHREPRAKQAGELAALRLWRQNRQPAPGRLRKRFPALERAGESRGGDLAERVGARCHGFSPRGEPDLVGDDLPGHGLEHHLGVAQKFAHHALLDVPHVIEQVERTARRVGRTDGIPERSDPFSERRMRVVRPNARVEGGLQRIERRCPGRLRRSPVTVEALQQRRQARLVQDREHFAVEIRLPGGRQDLGLAQCACGRGCAGDLRGHRVRLELLRARDPHARLHEEVGIRDEWHAIGHQALGDVGRVIATDGFGEQKHVDRIRKAHQRRGVRLADPGEGGVGSRARGCRDAERLPHGLVLDLFDRRGLDRNARHREHEEVRRGRILVVPGSHVGRGLADPVRDAEREDRRVAPVRRGHG